MKPSVTELISLLDKPGLMKWANKIGLEGTKLSSYRTSVQNHGTSKHAVIENFTSNGELSGDEVIDSLMVKFFSDKEIIDTEKSIETEYFTGRYDVKLKWNGYVFICDYKRSPRVYLENKLQLAAYKMAEPCDQLAVIHTKEFTIEPITIDMDLYSEFIITLSKLYELKRKMQ